MLAEVQQVCTSVTVLGRGRTLAAGPVDELLSPDHSLRIVVTRPEEAATVLAEEGIQTRRDGPALLGGAGTPPERVSELLGRAGHWVSELTPVRRDLESVYLELTAGAELGSVPEVSDAS